MVSTFADRLQNSALPGYGVKSPVLCASTGNITISGTSSTSVDGVTPSSGDRVLLKDQTSAYQNGVYIWGSATGGTLTRDADFSGNSDVTMGTIVSVSTGAVNSGKFAKVSSTGSGANGHHAFSSNSSTSDSITFTLLTPFNSTAVQSGVTSSGSAIFAATSSGESFQSGFIDGSTLGSSSTNIFYDTGTVIAHSTAATARFRFASSAITAGQTRVVTNLDTDLTQTGSSGSLSAFGLAVGSSITGLINTLTPPSSGTVLQGTTGANPSFTATPTLGSTAGAGTKGSLAFQSATAGAFTLQPSTATISYSLTLPSSAGSSGQFIQTVDGIGTLGFVTQSTSAGSGTVNSGSSGQVAVYSTGGGAFVSGTTSFMFDSGALTLGSSGSTAGSLVLASTGGGKTTLRGSTVAIAYTLAFPSSLGTTGQVLQLNTAGGGLGFGTPAVSGLTSKVMTFTRVMNTASGSVAYTGVGFTPTSIIFIGSLTDSGTITIMAGSADSSKAGQGQATCVSTPAIANDAFPVYMMDGTTSNMQTATISSYDADGFTLSWTKSGNPTGTANFVATCYK